MTRPAASSRQTLHARSRSGAIDVALLSLGTTAGLRTADETLAELLVEVGMRSRVVRVKVGAASALGRHIAIVDLVQGIAARRAAGATLGARAVIVSGATTALLLKRPAVPWAVRYDSPTALNRAGWDGVWQRARERHVLPCADVLLPWGEAAAQATAPLLDGMYAPPRMIVLPVPVETRPHIAPSARTFEAVAYAGWLWKRGVDVLCAAWEQAAVAGSRLVVAGCEPESGRAWLRRCGVSEPSGIEWAGMLPRDAWLDRVAHAQIFVNASRREDHGLAQLEALAAGTPLVSVPSPGPYEALPIARRLAPELVAADGSASALATAIRAGFGLTDGERKTYAERATVALAPYRHRRILEIIAGEVVPALGLDS